MNMDDYTIIEESIRKLKGIGFALSKLSSADDTDDGEACMFAGIGDELNNVAGNLKAILEKLE